MLEVASFGLALLGRIFCAALPLVEGGERVLTLPSPCRHLLHVEIGWAGSLQADLLAVTVITYLFYLPSLHYYYHWGTLTTYTTVDNIIIYYDFLPSPRRGNQVKSITHTHNHQTFSRLFSVVEPFLQFIATASCNGIPPLAR